MTVAHQADERWEWSDGAPAGPSIDVEIASSRKGHRPYRMIRDAVAECVIHSPACEAWEFGRRDCRHVKRMVALAEQPALTLARDIVSLWGSFAFTDEGRREFAVAVFRMAEEAIKQEEAIADYRALQDERAERATWTEEQHAAHLERQVEAFG